jgi:hypothetical protein
MPGPKQTIVIAADRQISRIIDVLQRARSESFFEVLSGGATAAVRKDNATQLQRLTWRGKPALH